MDYLEFACDGLFGNVSGYRAGALLLPPRQIVLENRVEWTESTAGLANNYINLGILGVSGATKIIVPSASNTTGAFNLNIDDKRSIVHVKDINFVADGEGSGMAFRCIMPTGGSVLYPSFVMDGCNMIGMSETDYFDNGLQVIAWRPRIHNNVFRGPHGAGISSGVGIYEDDATQYEPAIGLISSHHGFLISLIITSGRVKKASGSMILTRLVTTKVRSHPSVKAVTSRATKL